MDADHGRERRRARTALGILVALAAPGFGCAGTTPESVAGHGAVDGAGDAGPLPEEERSITLTLWPFHELALPFDEKPLPLGGVEVCVARRRPYSGRWEDFIETHGPCAETEEGENLVLPGVPGLSELVITATKEGYRPAVFAVTTGPWDLDVTGPYHAVDTFDFSLAPSDAEWGGVSEVTVSQDRGNLWFYPRALTLGADASTLGSEGVDAKFLGGVRVSLSLPGSDGAPPEGDGPFYFLGGVGRPGATRTVPGAFDSMVTYAGALFVNLPAGEYEVNVDHPSASCSVAGAAGSPVNGYGRAGGVIRAPVLRGYSTTSIIAACFCRDSRDARTCGGLDSGAP